MASAIDTETRVTIIEADPVMQGYWPQALPARFTQRDVNRGAWLICDTAFFLIA
jgi:hypothetical protein